MCFNTYIQHIKAEKYRQFGFSLQFLNPIHWFQFADDAAVITGQESDMVIRVEKCSTFGIKKALTKSVQYLPKLLIKHDLIPTVKIGESFEYLGRFFDLSNQEHKSKLISLIDETRNIIKLHILISGI